MKLTKGQQRQVRQAANVQRGYLHSMDLATQEFQQRQEEDSTLGGVRAAADGCVSRAGSGFCRRNGLIFRRWTPPGRGEESEVEQLVVPKECRRMVLQLAHEIPLAGHLGNKKTRRHVLRYFYWPTLFRDVEQFCRACVACQKSSPRGVKKAPLIPLPIIEEPFSRVAMDIVGPLHKSRAGFKYVVVLCDYATR